MFAQIKIYADFHSRGNRSQAILQLLETGLNAVSTQPSEPLQDNVLQRLTVMETSLGELSATRD
ncbi:MAG TPA: hypothetical protein V6D15_04485 [Oculatellaceae cyanobacterium]